MTSQVNSISYLALCKQNNQTPIDENCKLFLRQKIKRLNDLLTVTYNVNESYNIRVISLEAFIEAPSANVFAKDMQLQTPKCGNAYAGPKFKLGIFVRTTVVQVCIGGYTSMQETYKFSQIIR
jgi:hypothetical protein